MSRPAPRGTTSRRTFLAGALAVGLAACAREASDPTSTADPTGPADPTTGTGTSTPSSAPPSPVFADVPGVLAALAALEERHATRIGVTAVSLGSVPGAEGQRVDHRADERFAMCSVFKPLAVAALLDAEGVGALDRSVPVTEADLVPYAPVTEQHVGGELTLRELSDAAITVSDNVAANLLLEQVGGPAGVTTFLRGTGDDVTRLDRTEPTLNEGTPGDERDTTTPAAIAATYAAVALGDALDDDERALVVEWLVGNTTGDARIRASVPDGWTVGDKTGSGGYGTMNDVAVLWPPDRPPLVLAVLTTRDAEGAEPVETVIAEAASIVLGALV